jgi:hypothetical protein
MKLQNYIKCDIYWKLQNNIDVEFILDFVLISAVSAFTQSEAVL